MKKMKKMCGKKTRLIDAEALKERIITPRANGKDLITELIDSMPTIDAVPLDGSFLKMSKGDYLIYNRHWLYEHFDQEIDIQRSVMKSMGYEYVGKNTDAVRHGKWIKTDESDEWYGRLYKCSNCNTFVIGDMDNYCPYCGSRMDDE